MIRPSLIHALALGLAAAVFGAGSARADVRLFNDGSGPTEPALAIRLSPAGPWSLVGPLDETVLNPAGDTYSDGLPADAAQANSLLASWVRPGDGLVHLARWDQSSWIPLRPFDSEASIGMPRVAPLGTGWALTWQQLDLDPMIRAAGVSAGGDHVDSEPIIAGWLLDSTWLDDIQLVLHESPDRTTLVLTGVLWSIPGVPSPVDIVFSVDLGPVAANESRDDVPSPRIALIQTPGKNLKGLKLNRGAWSRRVAVSWWNAEGQLEQAVADDRGTIHHLDKPRFDPGTGQDWSPPESP